LSNPVRLVKFDYQNNRIEIVEPTTIGQSGISILPNEKGEYILTSDVLKDLLSERKTLTEKEQIEELKMMIHEIRKHRLLTIEDFLKKLDDIASKQEAIALEFDSATDMLEIKKVEGKSRAYSSLKNTVKEYRYVLSKLIDEEKALRTRIAKLETMTG